HFRLAPPPRLDVRVCTDLSCRLRGGETLARRCEQAARTRAAGEAMVAPVSCLGRCDGAPALTVNDEPFHALDDTATASMLAAIEGRGPLPIPRPPRPLAAVNLDPYGDGMPRWAALRRLVETSDIAGALAALKAADLRGLGGAGFPTAVKWEAVRTAP